MHESESGSQERRIDIFTAKAEVPFAGHPTIGTAHYLLKSTKQDVKTIVTKAGRIPISVDEKSGNVKAEIPHDFHRHTVTWKSTLNSLANPTVSIVNGMTFIMVEVYSLSLSFFHSPLIDT